MMGRRKKAKPYPTDSEAGALAQTARHPANLEETGGHAPALPAAAEGQASEGFCGKCSPLPALPDYRGTHRCARCRSEKL